MAAIKVSFEQFLNRETAPVDYSTQIKGTPCMTFGIPREYGEGRIMTAPLVGGAGLVIMECEFNRDLEIYSEHTVQESLSFTVCLQGHFINKCVDRSDIVIDENETLFARYQNEAKQMSSLFPANRRLCFVTIQLSTDWLSQDGAELQSDILNNPFWQGVYNSGAGSHLMLAVARDIVAASHKKDVQRHYLSAKVLELWSHQVLLLRKICATSVKGDLTLKATDVASIRQAADILLQEMADPPSLIELSRRSGINDNKLKRGFKQIYGSTVFGYLHEQRLQRAKVLICDKDCSVNQVASAVGFKSCSHFSHVFRQTFGVTPRQMRNSSVVVD